jgi:outer membrane lipoprotein-sorting protein
MYATLLVLAAMPSPQAPGDGKDATSLLTAVANNVRSAKSWRIEGHVAVEDGSKGDSAHDFKFYSHPPDQARYEADDTVAGRTLIVCDDEKIWTYSSKTGHYARLARSKSPNYTDETNREWFSRCGIGWDTLAMGLASAVFAGHDTVEFDSKPRGCEAVRAEYITGSTSRVLRRVRTVCIDPDRLMILRERLETDYGGRGDSPVVHRIETTTYSTVARDAELDSDLFIFEPPAGSTMLSISAPVPIYRPDPKYPKEGSPQTNRRHCGIECCRASRR